MSIRKHILLLLFFALFLLPAGKGADSAFQPDTTRIKIRQPDARHIAEYRDQKAFYYTTKKENFSFQLMLQQWLVEKLNWLFRLFNHAGSVEWFLVIMIVLAIISIILRINDINPIALFRRKTRTLQQTYDIGKESIALMDFHVLIDEASRQGNYRLAVRYHYLQTLLFLARVGKIQPRDEKTNREYLSELGSGEIKTAFAGLVYGFEFIWYGEFVPDEMQYQLISSAFIEFQKSLAE